MAKSYELMEQQTEFRDLARRARRLARTLSNEDDQARLQTYAEELEEKAADLGKRATA